MDLYTVNLQTMDADELIEDYESLIWTERYSSWGDFKLTVLDTAAVFSNLKVQQYYLRTSLSNHLMMVETVSKKGRRRGRTLLEITGRSLEHFLQYRTNLSYFNQDPERVTGSPSAIANYIVNRYCIDPVTAGAGSVIPGLTVAPPVSGTSMTLHVPRKDIYSIVKEIAEANDLGFRIGAYDMAFSMYDAMDYSDPAGFTYVEMSPDTDSLKDIGTLESVANYKNHAVVIGAKTFVNVFTPGLVGTPGGLDRRTIIVDAKDIGGSDPPTTIDQDRAALTLRGLEALKGENKYVHLIDGDLREDTYVPYLQLGNVVMAKDSYGTRSRVRVTEMITSMDATGFKRAPTFTAI